MRNKLALIEIIIGITTMGIFSLKKKNNKPEQKSGSVLLGMILLEESNSLKIKSVVKELREKMEVKCV